MWDGFDRAPGGGRGRGRGLGTGTGRGRGREAETPAGFRGQNNGEESGKITSAQRAGGLQQQEPLRPPLSSPRLGGNLISAQINQKKVQISVDSGSMAVSKGQPADSRTVISKLSANAAEFYPSGYFADGNSFEEDNAGYPTVPDITLAGYVQDILNHLTEEPGSFEIEIPQFTDVLNGWVTTEELLGELVELIYEQATSVPNFSYTGARLCNHLSSTLQINQNWNFRHFLLKRCQTEFEKRHQAAKGIDATRKRFHAFVLFLGELYLNLEIKGAKGQVNRAEILQSGLKELLDALFSNPLEDNLICAVKLLKLTGSVLEDAWKEKGVSYMDEVIQRMKNVVLDADRSRLKMDVRQMLLKLVELRSSNWGRVHSTWTFKEATPENDPNYFMNEPTFYTSEGIPFTAADPEYQEKYQEMLDREDFFCEETGTDLSASGDAFLDDLGDDEMDPEMQEAYEKFCLESEHKRKQ